MCVPGCRGLPFLSRIAVKHLKRSLRKFPRAHSVSRVDALFRKFSLLFVCTGCSDFMAGRKRRTLQSACCLARGAEPGSWLLFTDRPATGPSPMAAGEGPHRVPPPAFYVGTMWLSWSFYALVYYLGLLKRDPKNTGSVLE